MTVETFTVTADPPQIPADELASVAAQAAGPLGLPAAKLLSLLQHPTSTEYVVLASGVPATNESKLEALNLPGIYESGTYARAYPDGESVVNLVGLTHVSQPDDVISGYAGLEEVYDKLLTGTAGKETVERSASGQQIPLAGSQDTPAVNGQSIETTIIPALQLQAQQACEDEVKKAKARNCTAVAENPKTGAILAMAQWPASDGSTNFAVQHTFTPGSTAKVITAAAALEHGGKTLKSSYNIPYVIYKGGQAIHDAEWTPGEKYTIAGIVANSSNVGMSQVVESVPQALQYAYLKKFGLDEPDGLNLPGETQGLLAPVADWYGDTRYTLAYGQGIAVNAVQMAGVYSAIANAGVKVAPTLVAGTYSASGKYKAARAQPSTRVIEAKTARELTETLQQVPGVDAEANQNWGEIKGYAIAAKTGTANEPSSDPRHPCPKSNPQCVYGASYIGYNTNAGQKVVVAVNVQNPDTTTDYFGDEVAGPVFFSVMNAALQALKIQPQPGLKAPYVQLNAG